MVEIHLVGCFSEQIISAMPKRNIAGLAWLGGETNPDKMGCDRFKAVGFGINGNMADAMRFSDPSIQRHFVGYSFIGAAVYRRFVFLGFGRRLAMLCQFRSDEFSGCR